MNMHRRAFLFGAAAVGAALPRLRAWAGTPAATTPAPATTGPFTLPALPYGQDALAPTISANTMSFHYGKHHQAYVDNLNKLVVGTELEKQSLDAVIKATVGTEKTGIFNNAAQISHHTFYWNSMKPQGGGAPPAGALLDAINKSWGSWDKLKAEFNEKASKLFGSGWCWIVAEGDAIKVVQTKNADLPTGTPLLVIDVWEHAYYLDFMNKRTDYVTAWTDKLLNWDFAVTNFKAKK
jgi:superoxide dismutase, Fe-Mn family